MERIKKIFTKQFFEYTAAACIAVILYVLLCNFASLLKAFSFVWGIISPIVTGIIVAYLFNPVAIFFEEKVFKKIKKKTTRHLFGVIMAAVCFILIISLLLVALVPSLAQSVSKLIANWKTYTQKAESLIETLSVTAQKHNIKIDLSNIQNMVDNSMDQILTAVKTNSKTILSKLGQIGNGISNFAIGLVFGFCFLMAKDTLIGVVKKTRYALFKADNIEKHDKLFNRCNNVFIRYIGCTLLDAFIVGIATLIFALIAKTPYAPLIAAVVAVTNIIPTFGPMIGAAIGIFFIILESPVKAIIFFVFICVLQSIDGMVIKPKLFSGSLGIPALWTLILILLGGKIAGMIGILLAVPFGAIFIIIYNETIEPKLEKRASKINKKENQQ
ncbi:MAG: AI-2E family transporter [Ruminococcaceae bacterium]|nr:AI-2E family transporter [Oscillospiraceae bacterium]